MKKSKKFNIVLKSSNILKKKVSLSKTDTKMGTLTLKDTSDRFILINIDRFLKKIPLLNIKKSDKELLRSLENILLYKTYFYEKV
tara:strand:+ start:9480 stop:9734 length:255 start_codon:yes stop_codon:yes gene_type:complete